MLTERQVAGLRRTLDGWRAQGQTIALVPTMGALHAGHLSLVGVARAHADRVVASLFVNPRQFGPSEDFARYPRNEAADAAAFEAAGIDLFWAPDVAAMYPQGFATSITVEGPAAGMEADTRPGFFAGVATVVAKLFTQTGADVAVFGEKDWQQLQVIGRMAADLDLRTRILSGPTVRETDGLAMSSRNAYLSPAERARAAELYATLERTAAALVSGRGVATCLAEGRGHLAERFDGLDYLELREAGSLAPLERLVPPARLLAAVRLGSTRLIDNIAVAPAAQREGGAP
jgi:pantoate--beta-alanine ligase